MIPKDIKEFLEQEAYDHATLADWYISSVDNTPPIWTEAHIEELINDFYIIPRDFEIKPLDYLNVRLTDEQIAAAQNFLKEMSQSILSSAALPHHILEGGCDVNMPERYMREEV